jgi:hypothetical protein
MASATESLLSLAAATASFVDVDLNRKTRVDAIQWREQDLAFMDEQRMWHQISLQQRREDMNFRRQEVEQRNLVNRRRDIDEKNEQLKNIANIAALIAGFSVVVLIEMNLTVDVPDWLLSIYAGFSALTCCLMTYAYVTCTLILVATLKKFEVSSGYNEEDRYFNTRRSHLKNDGTLLPSDDQEEFERQEFQRTRFMLFWENSAEGDWNRAYRAFSLGVPCFLISICFAAGIKFYPVIIPCIVVSILSGCTIFLLFWDLHMKWGVFLASSPKEAGNAQRPNASHRGSRENVPSNMLPPHLHSQPSIRNVHVNGNGGPFHDLEAGITGSVATPARRAEGVVHAVAETPSQRS